MWFQITDPPSLATAPASSVPVVDRLVALVRASSPACGNVVVVAVDGRSGTGKTSLSLELGGRLGSPVVHLDDIYPGWDGLAAAVELLTEHVLAPLAAGRSARYPTWDWVNDTWGPSVSLDPTPFLVVEGCGASVGHAGRYAAQRVWLEAPTALRRQRGAERDGETFMSQWDRWAAQEDAVFRADNTRAYADIVISTAPIPQAHAEHSGDPAGRTR